MKKSAITLGLILGLIGTNQAMAVKLASKEVLAQRLRDKNFSHFDKKTGISTQLGSQEKAVIGVIMTVNQSMADYSKGMPTSLVRAMRIRIPKMIEALLADSPEAVQEAESLLVQSKL